MVAAWRALSRIGRLPLYMSHLEIILESQAHIYHLARPPGQVGSFRPAQVASPNLLSQGCAVTNRVEQPRERGTQLKCHLLL